MTNWMKTVLVAALLTLLSACGGNNSPTGATPCLASSCGSSSSSSGGVDTYTVSMSATLTSSGATATALRKSDPVNIIAVVKNSSGTVVPGAVVSFSTNDAGSTTTLAPDSDITDANGAAETRIEVNSELTAGTVIVTATAQLVGTTVSDVSQTFALPIVAEPQTGSSSGTGSSTSSSGGAQYLQYVSTSPDRITVSTGSQGNVSSETSTVTFKVTDSNGAGVVGVPVYLDVTRRDGGVVTTNATNGQLVSGTIVPFPDPAQTYPAITNSQGIVSMNIRSGTQPLAVNALASLSEFVVPSSGAAPAGVVVSGVQIVIAGLRPSQTYLQLYMEPGNPCADGDLIPLVWPCKVTAVLGDRFGQAVPDGTAVIFGSSNGTIVATVLAGQPSGVCLTSNSTCTVNFYGSPFVERGAHVVVAYTIGDEAPPGKPVTKDGKWSAEGSGIVASNNVLVSEPDSDRYIRTCTRTAPRPSTVTSTCTAP